MGLRPKFNVGDLVIDAQQRNGSESLVKIISRTPILEGLKIEWNYFGYEYEVQGNPIVLKYKTTITARESKFLPLGSRIYGPQSSSD
jgi:hypothetical protein